jgi:hypothetical protein
MAAEDMTNNARIEMIGRLYPDLASVAPLYSGASAARPEIQEYAHALDLRDRLTPIVKESVEKALGAKVASDCVVYIAGPLTGVAEELKDRYGAVSSMLEEYPCIHGDQSGQGFFGYVPHLHGTDPVKHPNVTPDEVRDIDFLWAGITSDYQVNFLSPTAHGNAIEAGWAEQLMIPAVQLNPKVNRLSRLTLGLNNIMADIEYDDFYEDGMPEVHTVFDGLYT